MGKWIPCWLRHFAQNFTTFSDFREAEAWRCGKCGRGHIQEKSP